MRRQKRFYPHIIFTILMNGVATSTFKQTIEIDWIINTQIYIDTYIDSNIHIHSAIKVFHFQYITELPEYLNHFQLKVH